MSFWLLLGTLCILGVLALLVISLVCTRFGFQRCASCWTRPEGGGRWEHYLCYPWEFAGQHEILPVECIVDFVVILRNKAVYASYDGTAQSLWL